LQALLANEPMRASLADKAYALVRGDYSAETMAEKYTGLYLELAGDGGTTLADRRRSGAQV
jgi:glycosyltransferase involved in cell wall biosynthesis